MKDIEIIQVRNDTVDWILSLDLCEKCRNLIKEKAYGPNQRQEG